MKKACDPRNATFDEDWTINGKVSSNTTYAISDEERTLYVQETQDSDEDEPVELEFLQQEQEEHAQAYDSSDSDEEQQEHDYASDDSLDKSEDEATPQEEEQELK